MNIYLGSKFYVVFILGEENDNLDHYKEVARSLSMKSKKYDKTHREFEVLWSSCFKYTFTVVLFVTIQEKVMKKLFRNL